jgi:hypothetical protein
VSAKALLLLLDDRLKKSRFQLTGTHTQYSVGISETSP